MKKVLITGLGYIGGRLALHLTKVPGLSVAVTTLGESIPDSVRDVLGDISVIPMDLLKDDIEKLAKKIEGFDAIVHLATINENQSVENPAKAIAVNTVGTFNILQASVLSGIEKFIYFSTAHVYAAPLVGNISEKNLTRPTHPYAYTHRAAEDYVLATRDTSKLDAIVIRLSNSFGPPAFPEVDRWTLLSNDLCRQAVQNGKMVLRSSGLQERDFITLEDVCLATQHLLQLNREQTLDGLFNVGGEFPISVSNFTKMIQSRCSLVLGFVPEILKPVDQVDISDQRDRLKYDIEKLKSTGFNLKSNVNDELDSLLLFCCSHFNKK